MDLKKVVAFMHRSDNKLNDSSWTLSGLISGYNKITSSSDLQMVRSFFISSQDLLDPKDPNSKPKVLADIFMDELDEISPKMQELILRIIARDMPWKKCQTRLWISVKSHQKARLETLFADANVYELTPLTRSEQIYLITKFFRTKEGACCSTVPESKLKRFVEGIHDQIEKLLPNFYSTIGTCPGDLLQVSDFFAHLVSHLKGESTQVVYDTLGVSLVKIMEKLVKGKFEIYVDKVSFEQAALAMSSVQFRDNQFRKLERIHVKAVIASYPHFKADTKTVFTGNANHQEQAHELYRVGICYEHNGEVRFVHKMYGEFIMAQYYVDSGRLKNASNSFISFFLNNILFDEECKNMRKFFDAYLTVQQQERRKIREIMVWTRLRCFLTRHYRLNDEVCSSISSEDDDVHSTTGTEGKERSPHGTFEDIKSNGSVIHIAIIEGHFKILQMIIDCFKGFSNELRRLLSMTVELEIFKDTPFTGNPFDLTIKATPEQHTVDAFQMLALYGYGSKYMEKFIVNWYHYFGASHMAKYYAQGSWTVVHYSAMNSNCHFLHALLAGEHKWEGASEAVNYLNTDGLMPIHLVLAKTWYYSVRIKDHPHPGYKACSAVAYFTSSAKNKNAGIKDAKESASTTTTCTIKEEPITEAYASSSTLPTSTATKRKGGSAAKAQPPRKTCKTVAVRKPIRRQSQSHVMRVWKDIWCFEGIDKEFVLEWDDYPDDVPANPLQPHIKTISLLLENGADVNRPDEVEAKTILHQAAEHESIKIIRFLLQKGADANIKDDFGKTPPDYAVMSGNMDVLEAIMGKLEAEGSDNSSGEGASSPGESDSNSCTIS